MNEKEEKKPAKDEIDPCTKPFNPESQRLSDADEACEDGETPKK